MIARTCLYVHLISRNQVHISLVMYFVCTNRIKVHTRPLMCILISGNQVHIWTSPGTHIEESWHKCEAGIPLMWDLNRTNYCESKSCEQVLAAAHTWKSHNHMFTCEEGMPLTWDLTLWCIIWTSPGAHMEDSWHTCTHAKKTYHSCETSPDSWSSYCEF